MKDAGARPKDRRNVGGDKKSQTKFKEVNENMVWFSEWKEDLTQGDEHGFYRHYTPVLAVLE